MLEQEPQSNLIPSLGLIVSHSHGFLQVQSGEVKKNASFHRLHA